MVTERILTKMKLTRKSKQKNLKFWQAGEIMKKL